MDLQVLEFLTQSDVPTLLSRAREKLNDYRDRRLRLFVVGRTKAGKSTLLNALMGADILPVDVIPCSATLVEIGSGEPTCVVSFLDAPDEEIPIARLADYISESHNPDNRKGVHQARIRHPSGHLESRTLWYDTPGVDSIHPLHERILVDNYHRADGVIVLYRASTGFSQHELDLLQKLRDTAGRILLVQNDDSIADWEDSSFERIIEATRSTLEERDLTIAGLVRLDILATVRGDVAAAARMKDLRNLIDQTLTTQAESLKQKSLVLTLKSYVDQALSLHVTQREAYRRSMEEIDALVDRISDLIKASAALQKRLREQVGEVFDRLQGHTDTLVSDWFGDVVPALDAMLTKVTYTTDFSALHEDVSSLLLQTLTSLCNRLDEIQRRELGDLAEQLEQAIREEHESLERELRLASLPPMPYTSVPSGLYFGDIAGDARTRDLLGRFAGLILLAYDRLAFVVQQAIRAIVARIFGPAVAAAIDKPLAEIFKYLRQILGTSLTNTDVDGLREQLQQRVKEHLLQQQQHLAAALRGQLEESQKCAEEFIRDQVGTQLETLRARLVDVQQRRKEAAPDAAITTLDEFIGFGRRVSVTLDRRLSSPRG